MYIYVRLQWIDCLYVIKTDIKAVQHKDLQKLDYLLFGVFAVYGQVGFATFRGQRGNAGESNHFPGLKIKIKNPFIEIADHYHTNLGQISWFCLMVI